MIQTAFFELMSIPQPYDCIRSTFLRFYSVDYSDNSDVNFSITLGFRKI